MHKNPRFNIIQATHNSDEWSVIDGQRMPGGYAAPGAKVVAGPLKKHQAIFVADAMQAIDDKPDRNPQ